MSVKLITKGLTIRSWPDTVWLMAQALTISTGAYADGDNVGGKLTWAGAMRDDASNGLLQSITVLDKAQVNSPLHFYFFSQDPSNGTYADNSANAIHDTDLLYCRGVVSIYASDYVNAVDNSVGTIRNLALPVGNQAAVASDDLYCLIQVSGTPTYSSTSDLTVVLGLIRE